ncbi:helix-turn-helix domain-containing protein [Aneurinibacillus tyrosinisolvens]|uniref:helix-turn-helix domain-containing protein n=1 Tax=Aneurinibacillus tyrosinisolvens TaxID=1443435 RepID=UPI001F1F592A|nr:helix-turn-helix domain-containing protein [Aneurinibacillus tyrosinisolvens]
MSLTNQELGDFCGTTRERVNRILGDMRKEKIISVKQGYITIHDLEQLREMNDCEDCPIDICRM